MGRAMPAGGRAGGGEAGAGPAAPPGPGRAGGGAGRGQRRISALSIRLLRLAPASAPAPSVVRATRPAPSSASPASRAAAAATARRAPPAAPAPCPPAARAPPPNPRGGRRRCCPYCCFASSGRREPDQEPVSTRRPAPLFPPGLRACARGAAAGGGGAGATWTAGNKGRRPRRGPRGVLTCGAHGAAVPRPKGLASVPEAFLPEPPSRGLPAWPPGVGEPRPGTLSTAGTRRAHETASRQSLRGTSPGRGRTR